jgi:carboxymethylenebutenolidase
LPDLSYNASSGQLRAYLALPRSEGPWPGVVVIQDVLGLTDDIRQQCDRLAAGGYLALAPDLYSGRGPRCVIATIQGSRSGRGPAYDDIEAARRWLIERDDCTGRVGIIGFCMGGGFALLSAPRYEFAAASVNYGDVPEGAVERLRGACPIVASYGRRDRRLRGEAQRLEAALTELGVPHDVKEYPEAGHSFLNRINVGPLFLPLARLAGFDYHHPSAEDAWRRIFAFFDQYLSDGTDSAPPSEQAAAEQTT